VHCPASIPVVDPAPSTTAEGQGAGSHAQEPTVDDMMHARRRVARTTRGERQQRVELSSAAIGVRHRTLRLAASSDWLHQVQTSAALRGRVRIDSNGRYEIHAGAASGRGFRGGWNTKGIGSGSPAIDVALKELFVSLASARLAVELQAGGLFFNRGESTEATSYDNDGYLVGERVTFGSRLAKGLDELAVTRAYLGGLRVANVFRRLERLDRANYYQVLARKDLRGSGVSLDYTRHEGVHVLRSAASVALPWTALVHRVRLEHYARLAPEPARGFAAAVQRRVTRSIVASGGLSKVDSRFGDLNGDLYGTGTRAYGSVSRRFGTAWLASVQVARSLDSAASDPKTRWDVAMAFDALSALTGRR
jgi:hypothetical protein